MMVVVMVKLFPWSKQVLYIQQPVNPHSNPVR